MDSYFSVERQESLQTVADFYFDVERQESSQIIIYCKRLGQMLAGAGDGARLIIVIAIIIITII